MSRYRLLSCRGVDDALFPTFVIVQAGVPGSGGRLETGDSSGEEAPIGSWRGHGEASASAAG
jgi:hypothetical protein